MVDPLPDLSPYLSVLTEKNLSLTYVIDTHVHADHLSGAYRLAQQTGATLIMHESAPLTVPFRGVQDYERLALGNVDIDVWHTPGHTPEHVSLLVTDRRRGPEPWCILTGHTLMIGDAGRPDLVADSGADALYHSLFERLARLPDYVEIFPGAYAGST